MPEISELSDTGPTPPSPRPAEGARYNPLVRFQRLPLWQPLGVRDFRLLWAGESISVLGDQFYAVAMPWLALLLTGSSLALGTVLMAAAIPRAVLMIGGGAVVDRVSRRTIMLGSNAVRAVLVLLLGSLVFSHHAQLWQLYVLSVLFGTADALFYPAFSSIPSVILQEEQLSAGNALLQGTAQVSGLIGPGIAGVVIAALPRQSGAGVAFLVDGASFVLAAGALALMRTGRQRARAVADEMAQPRDTGLLDSITAGLSYAWRDPVLRALLGITVALNFAASGPMNVGLPVIARTRFPSGAAVYGIMLATLSAGTLLGTIVAGSIQRPPRRGLLLIGMAFLLALGLAVTGLSWSLALTLPVLGVMGIGIGFINIVMMTWLQVRTDPAMMGRMFGVVLFAAFALAPLGMAGAGAIAAFSVTLMLILAACIMSLSGLAALASRTVRTIE